MHVLYVRMYISNAHANFQTRMAGLDNTVNALRLGIVMYVHSITYITHVCKYRINMRV